MSVKILVGDVFERLAELEPDSVDCVVTSPPYWGLRDYEVEGQMGMEPTLGEHLDVMVRVFDAVRRVMKPTGTLWLNYGDCYATKRNGRSAADTKAAGNDDRTFRDKPFDTVGPIYVSDPRSAERRGHNSTISGSAPHGTPGRVVAGGILKPKDLCMIPNRLAIALQEAGWWVRSEIVWAKPNAMPDSSGKYRPSTSHEKVFLLTKSAHSFYDDAAVKMPVSGNTHSRVGKGYKMPDNWDTGPGGHGSFHRNGREKGRPAGCGPKSAPSGNGVNKANDSFHEATTGIVDQRYLRNTEADLSQIVPPEVWNIPTTSYGEAHFATFPPALVWPCISAGCPEGGTVLDPFGGSGTTGMVADRLGRDAILIELKPEYAEMAEERIRKDGGLYTDVSRVA